MRFAWLTDIHLDHAADETVWRFAREVADLGVDGVVMTGDLTVAPRLGQDLGRLADAWDVPAWFVLGNHDYWGSGVEVVRETMRRIPDLEPGLRWLPHQGPVLLTDEVALVGVDGWADARHGDLAGSRVRLRDYKHIEDLARHEFRAAVDAARALADAEGEALRALLEEAVRERPRVYVATHIPPFTEAARFRGQVTHPHWLPWVTCKAVGDALLDAAERHPDRHFTVLCGHMHHRADVAIRPNLDVRTGAAEYGRPQIQDVIEL